jgi:transposase
VRDCEWLADLLRHGLLKASFITPLEIRELRELTRYRQTLVKEQSSVANRVQRMVESGNIKLGQVASNALGVSGRLMLRALCEGETDGSKIAALTRGQLKKKETELRRALTGRLSQAQRFVLRELLDRYEELEAALSKVNEQIKQEVAKCDNPFVDEAVELLQTIPGIGMRVAEVIVSEIGVDMGCFATDGHLASWAGMCPGTHESAGKRQSGRRKAASTCAMLWCKRHGRPRTRKKLTSRRSTNFTQTAE